MKLELKDHEIKALQVAIIAKEVSHQKRASEYGREGDDSMRKLHWEQSCYYSDLLQKIKEQLKNQI